MTPAERLFWRACRNHRISGLHFRRQQIIDGFIADFYCDKLKLVVEIDGGIHEKQKDYDKERDRIIQTHGIQVVRFSNLDIIRHMDAVTNIILSSPTLPSSFVADNEADLRTGSRGEEVTEGS
jgi:very-short-patch-repair endonuclease